MHVKRFSGGRNHSAVILPLAGLLLLCCCTCSTDGAKITIIGAGKGITIVSGSSTSRVFDVLAGSALELRDLTVSDGYRNFASADGEDFVGGAIRLVDAKELLVSNCTLRDNHVQSSTGVPLSFDAHGGGAVGVVSTLNATVSTNVTILDTWFFDNSAGPVTDAVLEGQSAFGGAIFVSGRLGTNVTMQIHNSAFLRSRVINSDGGAIFVTGEVDTLITGTLFEDNGALLLGASAEERSSAGGAIFLGHYSLGLAASTIQCTMTIQSSTFRNNNVTFHGGAITSSLINERGACAYSGLAGISVVVSGCTFEDNLVSDLYNYGPNNAGGGALLSKCSFSTMSIDTSTFSRNSAVAISGIGATHLAVDGGAVFAQYGGTIAIQECDLDRNFATCDGGAVAARTASTILLRRCTLHNNSVEIGSGADHFGGALYCKGSTCGASRSTFSSNTAMGGGAAQFTSASGVTSEAELSQCTFYDNTASVDSGGAIQLSSTAAIPVLVNVTACTIYQNTAGPGTGTSGVGGIGVGVTAGGGNGGGGGGGGKRSVVRDAPSTGSLLTLHNNIIANNTGTHVSESLDVTMPTAAMITSLGFNLIQDQTGVIAGALVGSDLAPGLDPVLGLFLNNGGLTGTLVPQAGSPAIDASDNTLDAPLMMLDQRFTGFDRLVGAFVDIGSVEVQAIVCVNDADCVSFTDQCNAGVCNVTNAMCYASAANEGLACDDGLACNVGETCQSGLCSSGVAIACPDVDQCNFGVCTEPSGCTGSTPKPDTTICDDSVIDGVCQSGDECQAGTCIPVLLPNTTECLAAADVCDVSEFCTGSSVACPTNVFASASLVCRGSAGTCDLQETCTGSAAACPPDVLVSNGTECRVSAGICDTPELCTGANATCPADAFEPITTECRASSSQCDAAEQCTSTDTLCPADLPVVLGTPCNDSLFCTVGDQCNGFACNTTTPRNCSDAVACTMDSCNEISDTCENVANDTFCNDGAFCNGPEFCNVTTDCQVGIPVDCSDGVMCTVDVCDEGTDICVSTANDTLCSDNDVCSGTELCDAIMGCLPGTPLVCTPRGPCETAACDPILGCVYTSLVNGTVCNLSLGMCDPAEVCNGVNFTCPINAVSPNGTVCNASAGDCDLEEVCDGVGVACPTDAFELASTVCRTSVGPCDVTDTCSGSGPLCPADIVQSNNTVCRTSTGDCDAVEVCNGVSNMCPVDADVPDSVACDDGVACTQNDTCTSGMCMGAPVDALCDDTNACTTDVCNKTLGVCTNTLSNAGTVCATSPGECALNGLCTGANATCPGVSFLPTGTACNGSFPIVECGAFECSGASALCTMFVPDDTPCDAAEECADLECTTDSTCQIVADFEELLTGTPTIWTYTVMGAGSPGVTSNTVTGFSWAHTTLAGGTSGNGGIFDKTVPLSLSLSQYVSGDARITFANMFTTSKNTTLSVAGSGSVSSGATGGILSLPLSPATIASGSVVVTVTVTGTRNCTILACDTVSASASGFVVDMTVSSIFANTVVCRPGTGDCDVEELCDGTNSTCPIDAYENSTTVCRPSVDVCDMEDTCSGAGPLCPSDLVFPASTECRAVAGLCDLADNCDGINVNCTSDVFQLAGTVCRVSVDQCDVAETCTGSNATCPADLLHPNGTPCNDSMFCTVGETCQSGVCINSSLRDCSDGVLCTADVCNEITDMCVSTANDTFCNDGAFCNGPEFCNVTTDCQVGIPVDCSDGVMCTNDVCNEGIDMCESATNDTLCSDNDVCNGVEMCDLTTGCLPGTPLNCTTGNACSMVSCHPVNGCQEVALSNGTVCSTAAGPCDVPEVCDGVSFTCPVDVKLAAGTVCNTGGVCDPNDTCDGVSDVCAVGPYDPATTVCRNSTGACDPEETCTGSGPGCPLDMISSAGTVCRSPAGDCDVQEECDGASGTCPSDAFSLSTAVCRASLGDCDVPELCTGTNATCPADMLVGNGTVCRNSTDVCDAEEVCDGASPVCPGDGVEPATAECRAVAGPCDVPETCDGSNAACPADMFMSASSFCRSSAGVCDVPEMCTGNEAACPADGFLPATIECNAAIDMCDAAEFCTGLNVTCPDDVFEPATKVCRLSTDLCDMEETCSGSSAPCPQDMVFPNTTECRAVAGFCDLAENCDGTNKTCPVDLFQPATFECRASVGQCDVAENCTNSNAVCPVDLNEPDGTVCDDGLFCVVNDACVSGACAGNATLDCSDTVTCTADACNEITDMCTNTANDTFCNNGAFCNGSEFCNVTADCQMGIPIDCSDGVVCTVDVCDEGTDMCTSVVNDTLCDDGNVCNGLETCHPTLGCQAGTPLNCTTGNVCSAVSCDPTLGCQEVALPNTTACRAAAGQCDVAEMCDGVAFTCPSDAKASNGTVCNAGGVCDPAEVCDGLVDTCPANIFSLPTEVCRASTGLCDPEETCTGSGPGCPVDAISSNATVCRSFSGPCDLAEVCDGTSGACPGDALTASGVLCRASIGACDVPETCTGVNATCPTDSYKTAGTLCRASAGTCDPLETCTGSNAMCPTDDVELAGTVCRAPVGDCDVPEECDGVSVACPVDALSSSTAVCRASLGDCDVLELCTGTNATCPTDALVGNGTTCRASTGVCDPDEVCDGTSPVCPVDALEPTSTVCRASTAACDPAENCDQISGVCPLDFLDDALCDDTDVCTTDACVSTVGCVFTSIPGCQTGLQVRVLLFI